MQASAPHEPIRPLRFSPFAGGTMRNRSFDLLFVGGLLAIGLTAGGAAAIAPALFLPLLIVDLWLFGYHHVIATFTRLAFDRASLRQHRFLVFYLPPLVLAVVAGAAIGIGVWVVASSYLYWQWWHYTRQSYGIHQIYRQKDGPRTFGSPRLALGLIYIVPLWGIAHRSHQGATEFLSLELKTLPVPGELVAALGVVSVALIGAWLVQQALAWRAGRLAGWHSAYLASHVAIFVVGYLLIGDIDHGWLAINVWHNAQYILIVWMVNQNRFSDGVDPGARFLSTLSQPSHVVRYFVVSLAITTAVYGLLTSVLAVAPETGLPLAIIAYQTINFHHYVVDSFIWKVRAPRLRRELDIDQPRAA